MNPSIRVTQNNSLLDTSLEIRITNLSPCEIIRLKAEMIDNSGTNWESFAEFMSDNNGEINLLTAQPLSGTYSSPDGTGLFWSMMPVKNNKTKRRTPLRALETKLVLMRGQEVLTSTSVMCISQVKSEPLRN